MQSGSATCVRCGFQILPGTRWHLDHADDKIHYLGPSHARCNLKAAAKRGNALMRVLNPPSSGGMASREW